MTYSRSVYCCLAAILLLAAGCPKPRADDLPVNVDNGRDAGQVRDPGKDGPAAGPEAGEPEPTQDPDCPAGQHKCRGVCVDSRNPMHCGSACEPCPSAMGGEPTCNGVVCGIKCPPGQAACLDRCQDDKMVCDGTCPAGQN